MKTVVNLPRMNNSEERQSAGVLGVVWMISASWASVTSEHIHWAFEAYLVIKIALLVKNT